MIGEFDLASTDRLLTTTRSVRRRLDLARPVPLDLMKECMQIALQAATGGNSQRRCWVLVSTRRSDLVNAEPPTRLEPKKRDRMRWPMRVVPRARSQNPAGVEALRIGAKRCHESQICLLEVPSGQRLRQWPIGVKIRPRPEVDGLGRRVRTT